MNPMREKSLFALAEKAGGQPPRWRTSVQEIGERIAPSAF
jgi:hypothetical protein